MALKVYWPKDLLHLDRFQEDVDNLTLIIGKRCTIGQVMVLNVVSETFDQFISMGINELKSIDANSKEEEVGIIGTIGPNSIDKYKNLIKFEVDSKGNTIRSENALIITYVPPIPRLMQFYSMTSIPISLVDNKSYSDLDCRMAQILQETLSDEDSHPNPHTDYSLVLDNLNNSWNQRRILIQKHPKMPQNWESSSSISRCISSMKNIIGLLFRIALKPFAFFWLYSILFIRNIILVVIRVLNKRIYRLPSLVELSATAQQVDLRLQQLAHFPVQYLNTTRLSSVESTEFDKSFSHEQYPEYIRFYNTLWLIFNDMFLGLIISSLLFENEEKVLKFIDEYVVSKLLFHDLNNLSISLMNSPGGIKLNNELSMFLSDLFRWIIEFWKIGLIDPFAPYYGHLIRLIAICSGTFGATLAASIFLDFLSVITFHIYCFYYSSAKIFNWLLNILLSLFYLFWGKKRNVLRKRIDSNDYESDQLLLGTLLFTVVTFLLPTVLAFYITFATTELLIMLILGTLEISTALLNHFPIFVLLVWGKDHRRIPGGIQLIHGENHIELHSLPIGLSEIFDHFNNVLRRLKEIYLSKKTAMNIIKGEPIQVKRNKLNRLLYSALPSIPVSTSQIWNEVNKSF